MSFDKILDSGFIMNHASLFSGIGGFDLAAEWMGWENIFQCEVDEFCLKVLNYYWPNAKKYKDIRNTDFTIWRGKIDVLTGGFPCQKYSHAGKRDGDEPLAKEMLRAIGESMPNYVVAENVYGFVTIDDGESLNSFCSDLEDIGYEKPVIFDCTADFTGLQTMERHIWIISKAIDVGCKRGKKIENKNNGNERQFQRTNKRIYYGRDISATRFCNVDQRVSRKLSEYQRERLRALGNAVPPQVAYQIFNVINND